MSHYQTLQKRRHNRQPPAYDAPYQVWLSSITDLKDNPLPFPAESSPVNKTKQSRPHKRRRLNTGYHKLPSPPASETTRLESAMAPTSPPRATERSQRRRYRLGTIRGSRR
ncbi:hypothetical protein CEP53_010849 [Fusarium sp. AF-6]|nr:hypothetical protein CEP53_010849 [Fusarium sp. AF-6]